MTEVSMLRLYVLRGAYLLIAIGLAVFIWPGLLNAPVNLPHGAGVMRAMLGAVSLLALLGVRYPLQMLPLILFELVWKTIWLLVIALPLSSAGALTEAHAASVFDCLFGVVLAVVVIPWGYVWRHYVRQPGDPWRRGGVVRAARPAA